MSKPSEQYVLVPLIKVAEYYQAIRLLEQAFIELDKAQQSLDRVLEELEERFQEYANA